MITYKNRMVYRKEKVHTKHQDKLSRLFIEQDRPIARVNTDTITILDNIKNMPEYVRATLAKGPRHPVLTKFDEKDIAAEINALIEHHERLECYNTLLTTSILLPIDTLKMAKTKS